jgi:short-subunit dehydrogenase
VTSGARYALITGASKGLGKYFARALAARKQNLILVARSKDKLKALAAELRNAHEILAEPLEFDLATPGAGLTLAQLLRERNLQVEVLVNNAGFGERGKFLELPLQRQMQMIHLQNTAVVELTYQLLPAMISAGHGGVINVSSLAGLQPVPYAAIYSATKSFLTTFSMALREELRSTGVTVVTVCPGRLRADPEDPEALEKRQKVPGGEQRHEDVVNQTLKKLDSGGGLVIPGRLNRLTVRGQRLMSLNAVPKIVAKMSKS